jgi:metal-sulfur cluster biosynthetic enzyme
MTDESVIERARAALREVFDPELGIDVVALGLVYDIRVEGTTVIVEMTLTTPGCPVAESLPEEATEVLESVLGPEGYEVVLQIVWDPPWTPDRLEDDAADALGFRGS